MARNCGDSGEIKNEGIVLERKPGMEVNFEILKKKDMCVNERFT